MTRVLALPDQSKIGCITQRRFAKVGTKTHPQRGAALDRNGLSVSTETACRFEPKSPVGNSEICNSAPVDHVRGPTPARQPPGSLRHPTDCAASVSAATTAILGVGGAITAPRQSG